jgi:DNA-binding NtrC family response regulator
MGAGRRPLHQMKFRGATEADPPMIPALQNIEHEAIRRALAEVGGNRRLAADPLGIGARTLYEKLKRHGIE